LSKIQIGRGAVFLYIENISAMSFGYAYWYILSRITSPDAIGITASLISIATIFVSIAAIGIPLGSQRFLGRLFGERRFEDARTVVKTSLFIITGGIVICSTVLIITSGWIFSTYDFKLVIVTIVLFAASTISMQFRYVIIASLETKKLAIMSSVSSGAKLFLTIILVLGGSNELGIMIGFTFYPLLTSVFFAFIVLSLLKGHQANTTFKFIKTLKPLLSASVVNWIPLLIDNIGAQIGTVIVLGIQGPAEAGIYFIAFQITVGISAVIWALESVTFPALSSMNEGRKMFLWRVIKIGLIIVLPLSLSLLFYSKNIMQIFGYEYIEGSYPLQILLLSILPTAITAGISILLYSYGNYRHVLIIGLAVSIPRAILYFTLIPWYGGTGAALSYTLGSVFGLIASLIIARRIGKILSWRQLILIFIIPFALGFIFSYFNIYFVIAVIVSIISSYILLLKFSIIDRNDVQDSMSLLPHGVATPITETINKIASKLNDNY
jgi:O-antigen/teichoic acid export membrane protein